MAVTGSLPSKARPSPTIIVWLMVARAWLLMFVGYCEKNDGVVK